MDDRKPVVLYLPLDADVVSVVVTRQIPVKNENGETFYQNGIISGCFNAVADAYDAFTGNSFSYDFDHDKWMVLESEEDEPLMPNTMELNQNNEEVQE